MVLVPNRITLSNITMEKAVEQVHMSDGVLPLFFFYSHQNQSFPTLTQIDTPRLSPYPVGTKTQHHLQTVYMAMWGGGD